MDQFLAILIGFVLTTVVGGWWATRLQQRSWDHQNDVRLQEAELVRAAEVSRELSQLLDRRLYRMRRLFWAIQNYQLGQVTSDVLDARVADYSDVLYEWNDRLNVNLALIGSNFGSAARHYLEGSYERYRSVGAALEAARDQARQGDDVSHALAELDPEFEGWQDGSLNQRNYLLALAMMSQLRDGSVGRRAPARLAIPSLSEKGA
jgi:hypothetical protein